MKLFNSIALSLAALAFANTTYATPVQYQITATHSAEFNFDYSQIATDYLFADGAPITLTFFLRCHHSGKLN